VENSSNDYVTRVLSSPDAIDAASWNALLAAQAHATLFMRHEYLSALHHSQSAVPDSGWTPRLFILEQHGAVVAGCVVYIKQHSFGEYVFDWSWARAYQEHGLPYYPKAVVAVPFTPVPGSRLLARSADARAALVQAVIRWCRAQHLSSLHVLFADTADMEACQQAGMMPRHAVQFHWSNRTPGYQGFDEFLGTLTQDKRKKIRQERRKVSEAGVTFKWTLGESIARADWDFFYQCYSRTYQEHGNPPYLHRDFFERVAHSMPENWLLFVAERAGRPIAASLIAIGSQPEGFGDARAPRRVAYGRYWGCVERVDCLHFEACYYQPLQWCIEHGFDRFEGGAQGEHKLARALLPVTNTSMHWLANPAFSAAVDRFLDSDRDSVASYLSHLSARTPFRRA
jgi:predicted N-acyltransferase